MGQPKAQIVAAPSIEGTRRAQAPVGNGKTCDAVVPDHFSFQLFCLWEDGAERQAGLGRSKYLDRLDSVLAGKRRLGQQTFEIVVSGYPDMTAAEQAVRQRMPDLIRLEAPTATARRLTPDH